MLELNNALELIIKTVEKTSEEYGFKVEYPDGVRPPELPIQVVGSKSIIMFRGENGRIRVEHNGDKISLHCARANEQDTPDDDMRRVSLSLLDLETFNEKDLKYLAEDYAESFKKNFSTKSPYSGKKAPTPVSRTQAKSGALSYDANTLGSRFTTIYPQLRDEYKRNLEAYGEFLAEDFFVNHGNVGVIANFFGNVSGETFSVNCQCAACSHAVCFRRFHNQAAHTTQLFLQQTHCVGQFITAQGVGTY